MPILGAMFINIITAVVSFLIKYMSQKIAITLILIAFYSALSAAVYVGMRQVITEAIAFSASYHPMFAAGISVVIPVHTAGLVTAYVGTWSLCELYKWKMSIMFLWNRTSW